MTTLAEVELRLRGARGCTSGGRMAMCPVHESEGKHTPSLHVWEENGEVAWHCFAGCDHAAVGEALGIERRNGSDPRWTPDGCGAPIAEYPYVEEQGRLLFTVVRCDDHTFPPWRPDSSSKTGKRWGIKGVRRVLYRLPQVLWAVAHDEVVYIAEGEKDADSLRAAGATATCNIGGAGTEKNGYMWRDEYSAALAGAHVIIVADKDAPGYAHASAVEAALLPVAASVGVVQAKTGKDASDHLAAGFGLEDFVAVEPDEAEPPKLQWLTGPELAALTPEEPDYVLAPYLARGLVVQLAGKVKGGKTTLAMHMAAAVLHGRSFLEES